MGKDAFSIKPELNHFRETSIDFKVVQSFRMIMVFLLTIIFLLLFYIFVRMIMLYLNAWIVVLAITTTLHVGYAAGRMAVEQKMLDRRRGSNSDEAAFN